MIPPAIPKETAEWMGILDKHRGPLRAATSFNMTVVQMEIPNTLQRLAGLMEFLTTTMALKNQATHRRFPIPPMFHLPRCLKSRTLWRLALKGLKLRQSLFREMTTVQISRLLLLRPCRYHQTFYNLAMLRLYQTTSHLNKTVHCRALRFRIRFPYRQQQQCPFLTML